MQTVKELDEISINLKLEYKSKTKQKTKIHVHKVSDMIENRVQFQWHNLFAWKINFVDKNRIFSQLVNRFN